MAAPIHGSSTSMSTSTASPTLLRRTNLVRVSSSSPTSDHGDPSRNSFNGSVNGIGNGNGNGNVNFVGAAGTLPLYSSNGSSGNGNPNNNNGIKNSSIHKIAGTILSSVGVITNVVRRRRHKHQKNVTPFLILTVVPTVAILTIIALVGVTRMHRSGGGNNGNGGGGSARNHHQQQQHRRHLPTTSDAIGDANLLDGTDNVAASTASTASTGRRHHHNQHHKHHHKPRHSLSTTVDDNIMVYDVAIAGTGPAGLTAALFASRSGLNVIVLGSSTGMLSQTKNLDNFPSYLSGDTTGGPGWLEATKAQAVRFGAHFAPPGLLASSLKREWLLLDDVGDAKDDNHGHDRHVHGQDEEEDDDVESPSYFTLETPAEGEDINGGGNEYGHIHAWSVIIASGATPRKLGLPHEDRLWGSTLHSCALCDGHLYDANGRFAGESGHNNNNNNNVGTKTTTTVLVVGGGDAAIDAAILLARYATTVIIVHRREDFSSAKNQVNLDVLHTTDNIRILTPYVIQEWVVDVNDESKLKGVWIQNTRDPSQSQLLDHVDGAFVMIGATPNTGWIEPTRQHDRDGDDDVLGIDLDEEGLIRLGSSDGDGGAGHAMTASSVPGIFAAGEVTDNVYKQAITAAAAGAQAAIDAERWLRERRGVVRRQQKQHVVVPANVDGGTNNKVRQEEQLPPPHIELGGENDTPCDMVQQECITSIVQKHPVVVFSKPWCPYCRKALEALSLAGVSEPYIIDLSLHANTQIIQATLQTMTGRRTVPNVFVGGRSIGGGDETSALQSQGKLVPLLAEAGAVSQGMGVEVVERGLGLENEQVEPARLQRNGDTGKEDCDLLSEDCFKEVLTKYPVVMFTLSWCPECKRSLELLDRLGVHPHRIDLDDYKPISQDIREHMYKMTNRRQVPNLFVGGEFVGGYQQTVEMHNQGELLPKFQKVGIPLYVGKEDCDLRSEDCFKDVINKYPVVMFSLRLCTECKRSLELLERLGVEPHVIALDDYLLISQDVLDIMMKLTNRRQVPTLFVGGEFIGGYQQTEDMHGRRELVPKLQQAGGLPTVTIDKRPPTITFDSNRMNNRQTQQFPGASHHTELNGLPRKVVW